MKNEIEWIEKGWGEGSTFFSTNPMAAVSIRVDEIKESVKSIGETKILTYVGFKNGKIVFEIEANSSLTIKYKE